MRLRGFVVFLLAMVFATGLVTCRSHRKPHFVALHWTAEPGAVYKVYRSEGTDARKLLAVVPGPGYTDYTVVHGHTYLYEVTAVKSGHESPSSRTMETIP